MELIQAVVLIALTNTAAPLTIAGISQAGGDGVTIVNTGALTTSGAITTTANGAISLTATGGTETIGAAITANGSGEITLSATGASSDILFSSTILTGTSSKAYNTNTAATLAAGNYSGSGAIDGDTITLNNLTSGTYASKNEGTNIGVSTTGITIVSATNSAVTVYGYTLSSTTASANIGTITPAPLTITPNSGQGKTYGTSDTVGGFTYTNIGLYAGDSINGNLGRAAGENVSNYAYNLGNLSNTNYTISLASSPPTFVITPVSLTINPTVGQTVAYGVSDPAAGFTYTNTGLKWRHSFLLEQQWCLCGSGSN